jgi:hypothetical protein
VQKTPGSGPAFFIYGVNQVRAIPWGRFFAVSESKYGLRTLVFFDSLRWTSSHQWELYTSPAEYLLLRIFRKILDLVTFFSQKRVLRGWFQGSSGSDPSSEKIFLNEGRLLFEAAFGGGVFAQRSLKHGGDNVRANSFKKILHFLDLRSILAHKRLLTRESGTRAKGIGSL